MKDSENGVGLALAGSSDSSRVGGYSCPSSPSLSWGGVGALGLGCDSLLPLSVHLQLHGVGTCVWLPGGQVQSEVSHVRGHCLLVPGDTRVVLHPQRGEVPRWLLLPPPAPPISLCFCSLESWQTGPGELVHLPWSLPSYPPCLPELICPPRPSPLSFRAFSPSPP